MSTRHRLTIHLSEGLTALTIDVRTPEWDRLTARLWNARVHKSLDDLAFVEVDTVDGRRLVLNLLWVERISSSTIGLGPQEPVAVYHWPTQIQMRGRASALGVYPSDDVTLGDLVQTLTCDPELVPWVHLVVDDGDELIIKVRDVVFVIVDQRRLLAAYEQFVVDSET